MPDLPATDQMKPRPVWARAVRRSQLAHATRQMGVNGASVPLGAPTEEEKQDAILILRDCTGYGYANGMMRILHVEAQRVMDDACR